MAGMTSITSITLEAADPAAARDFYNNAFDLGRRLAVREADGTPTSGFRGFTLSLVVGQPSTVDALIGSAIAAGGKAIKDPKKSMWGYGGVVQAPDGAIWKVATSAKKDKGPATRQIDDVVLLLGVADVKASRRFYVEHGLKVGKSFGGKYVEFEATPSAGARLALYKHGALAKDAGVPAEGRGSHRIAIGSDAAAFTDPDGFVWEPALG
jgi:predicted lactoylglutathione lyase